MPDTTLHAIPASIGCNVKCDLAGGMPFQNRMDAKRGTHQAEPRPDNPPSHDEVSRIRSDRENRPMARVSYAQHGQHGGWRHYPRLIEPKSNRTALHEVRAKGCLIIPG